MIRPEMEVVIAVGKSRAESEFRRHQVVAVPFAVNVPEAADVEPPIEVVGDAALAHRKRVRETVADILERHAAVAVENPRAVRAGSPHDAQITAAGDQSRGRT